MTNSTLGTIYLKDYRPPDYRVVEIALEFDLDEESTRVRSRMRIVAPHDCSGTAPDLRLDGDELELVSISMDGKPLEPDAFILEQECLMVKDPPSDFVLEIETIVHPSRNTRLEGLYVSSDVFCTQCEAEGFRRITYFPDRPDVLAVYSTTIRADRARYPVLLSNGNLIEERELEGGRHMAVWHDPFPKPSYLFALVAGDLGVMEDRYRTGSGREVRLRIFTEHGNEPRCAFAMESLKRSMAWDEDRFGLEYDLDLFNIVAVSDFNMGAMENKSLNVFNAKYVLADAETATDDDYLAIESIVAHEYFHNWTGNRVTCRDWFQLSLKEGLTVFRDQAFSADMRSGPVERIKDVRALRARQFPEDSGPLAHPVRPDSYVEINNFYTATVYEKGAELIGMMHTLLGRDAFRKGMDLYFERHDGGAVTCDDFVQAMEDASGVDLGQFRLWYSQAGTPRIMVEEKYDEAARVFTLTLQQKTRPTPGQNEKAPLHIPLRVALMDEEGKVLPLKMEGNANGESETEGLLELKEERQVFRFWDVPVWPEVSLNRGFSAPVVLETPQEPAGQAFLMAHDTDPFNRWEAGQTFAQRLLLDMVAQVRAGEAPTVETQFVDALGRALADQSTDNAFLAQMLILPSEGDLGLQMETVDVDSIHQARQVLRNTIAQAHKESLLSIYRTNQSNRPYDSDTESMGRRSVRNMALSYIGEMNEPSMQALVLDHYHSADNMTDRMAALRVLTDLETQGRTEALDEFFDRFKDNAIVIDKWFSLQAVSSLPDTLAGVKTLVGHPAFSISNPNRVRALIGVFCSSNPLRFHAADGTGYAFLADQVLTLDGINPQVAARLLSPLGHWRRFDGARQKLMKSQLERILAHPSLSKDSTEIASKSLV